MRASDSVTALKGVGESVAAKLSKLGIFTVADLVSYVPRRYEDYSHVLRVSQIKPGPVTIRVRFRGISARYSRRGLHMTEAMASDESGSVKVVWFNQPYRAASIKEDEEYFVSGEFAQNHRFFAITNPACELVSSFPVNTARMVPVYGLTKGLGLTQLRKIIKTALTSYAVPETLPKWILEKHTLIDKHTSLLNMHFPKNNDVLSEAKERLGFEEVFELTLASELNKQEFKAEHALEIPFKEDLIKKFVQSLPFHLTDDQRRAAWEVFLDMQTGRPMNRLVEGDVGSGKTVVAGLAALGALESGFQVAFMAPTEILASQHRATIETLFRAVGKDDSVVFLSGSMSVKQKQSLYKRISDGESLLIIGTHALFQDKVTFTNLGLIIVDEQHRFGVQQRKSLQAKADKMPHVLNLTATPIPRTLALTLYGEMDISVIAQSPSGRKPVKTKLVIHENRQKIYETLKKELDAGHQGFVVCPQIEEGEDKRLSVKHVHSELQKNWLKDYKIALLHGKLTAEEKDEIMQRFSNGDIDVLVATTVIEVGVDVPNATMMIIEGADRFGLAQLHQLRGRVGRGEHTSSCYLVLSNNDTPSKRLKVIEYETNGFKLAEYDLELRGPGAIYGTMQHGALDLRVAKLTDVQLIKRARQSAKEFVSSDDDLLKYKELAQRVTQLRTINNLN